MMNYTKHIPNTITCCNLVSGCLAIVAALFHSAELALSLIIIGAIFDFFDGMSARLLHVSSPIGYARMMSSSCPLQDHFGLQ